jgi:hypothetical protein
MSCWGGVGTIGKTVGLFAEPVTNRVWLKPCASCDETNISWGRVGVCSESALEYWLCFWWDASSVASAWTVVVWSRIPIRRPSIFPGSR